MDPWIVVNGIRRIGKEDLVPIIGVTAATSLLYSAYCHLFPKSIFKVRKGAKEIPVPEGSYPYIGHYFALGDFPGRQIHQWHQQLGPVFGLHMGTQHWVMIDNPRIAHHVMTKNGAFASNRPHTTFGHKHYGIGGRGIVFAQPGPQFRASRGAALQILAHKQIDKFSHIIYEESDALVNRLIEATESEGSVFPKPFTTLFSLNVIHSAIFGYRFDKVDHPDFLDKLKLTDDTMYFAAPNKDLSGFFPILSLYDYFFGAESQMVEFIQTKRNPIYKNSIRLALESKSHNLIKMLATYDLEIEDIIVITSDLINGGTDTTAVTLQWFIPLMCNYADEQAKARAELDAFMEKYKRLPFLSERNETPYTFAMLRECMRFKAVTPIGTPHVTTKDIEVDGYIIPEGSTLFTGKDALHLNPANYTDPEKFMPERFLGIEKSMSACAQGNIEHRDHFNFGWGRRLCPGTYLAETQLFAAVTKIIHRCLIEPCGELPDIDTMVPGGLMSPPVPYRVRIAKRSTTDDHNLYTI